LNAHSVTLEALASGTRPWPLGISLKVPQASLKAKGSVTHPFQGRGFDLAYEIAGKNLKELGPVTDLLLPLSGAYRLTGRFTDDANRYLLNDIQMQVGQSDVAGSMIIVMGGTTPQN